MTYPFLIMPDLEEGVEITQDKIKIAFTENEIDDRIRQCSNNYPNSVIMVYELRNMYKIKRRAEYQRYRRDTKTGEVLPE